MSEWGFLIIGIGIGMVVTVITMTIAMIVDAKAERERIEAAAEGKIRMSYEDGFIAGKQWKLSEKAVLEKAMADLKKEVRELEQMRTD